MTLRPTSAEIRRVFFEESNRWPGRKTAAMLDPRDEYIHSLPEYSPRGLPPAQPFWNGLVASAGKPWTPSRGGDPSDRWVGRDGWENTQGFGFHSEAWWVEQRHLAAVSRLWNGLADALLGRAPGEGTVDGLSESNYLLWALDPRPLNSMCDHPPTADRGSKMNPPPALGEPMDPLAWAVCVVLLRRVTDQLRVPGEGGGAWWSDGVIRVPRSTFKRWRKERRNPGSQVGRLRPSTARLVDAAVLRLSLETAFPPDEHGTTEYWSPVGQPWDDEPDGAVDVEWDERQARIGLARTTLEMIPEPSAELLRLHFGFHGDPLSIREIARKVSMSKSTVERRIQKAKDELRTAIRYTEAAQRHQRAALAALEDVQDGDREALRLALTELAGTVGRTGPYNS